MPQSEMTSGLPIFPEPLGFEETDKLLGGHLRESGHSGNPDR